MTDSTQYIALPSNASLDLYKDNTLTSYTVHLPEPIVLEGEHEIALASIIWPRTFYNITETSKNLYYQYASGLSDDVELTVGLYDTIKDLIDHINEKLRNNIKDNIQIRFEPISEKVFVSVKGGYKLLLENTLSHILGFGGKTTVIHKSQFSPFVTDLSGGIQCLYIYCDIAGYQIVGDTKAQLLKVLPVEGKYGDTIYRTFDVPTYHPIATKEFQDIKIDLRDDSGQKIHFNSGRVVVNLHIRQRQLSYVV
jgi:hypothetical protein